MKYGSIGNDTSASEVTDISPFGIWLLHRGKEHFLVYEDFPWFREATVSKVFQVVEEGPDHLRWPELDVDLSMKSIRDPRAYPLIYEWKKSYGEQDERGNYRLAALRLFSMLGLHVGQNNEV